MKADKISELLEILGYELQQLRTDECIKTFHHLIDEDVLDQCPTCHYSGTISVGGIPDERPKPKKSDLITGKPAKRTLESDMQIKREYLEAENTRLRALLLRVSHFVLANPDVYRLGMPLFNEIVKELKEGNE